MGRHSPLSRTFPDTAGAARRTWPTAGPLPEDAAAKGTSPAGLRAVREQPEGLASVWPDQGLRWGRSGGAMGDGGGHGCPYKLHRHRSHAGGLGARNRRRPNATKHLRP